MLISVTDLQIILICRKICGIILEWFNFVVCKHVFVCMQVSVVEPTQS